MLKKYWFSSSLMDEKLDLNMLFNLHYCVRTRVNLRELIHIYYRGIPYKDFDYFYIVSVECFQSYK